MFLWIQVNRNRICDFLRVKAIQREQDTPGREMYPGAAIIPSARISNIVKRPNIPNRVVRIWCNRNL